MEDEAKVEAEAEAEDPRKHSKRLLHLLGQPTANVGEVFAAAWGAEAELMRSGTPTPIEKQVSRLARKAIGGSAGFIRKRPELLDAYPGIPTAAFLTNRNDGRNACPLYPKRGGQDDRVPRHWEAAGETE